MEVTWLEESFEKNISEQIFNFYLSFFTIKIGIMTVSILLYYYVI